MENHKILPIMLSLCLMLLPSYYAKNYADSYGYIYNWLKPIVIAIHVHNIMIYTLAICDCIWGNVHSSHIGIVLFKFWKEQC